MITTLPPFVENEQYRQNRGGSYRFTTLDSITVRMDVAPKEVIAFHDKNGTEWARLQKGKFHIRPHYSWDGCTPKGRFAMLWVGTPDPQCTRLASLVHDVLYQFMATDHFPWSRKQADEAFYDLMHLSGFPLAGLFHGAVRTFGGLFVAKQADNGCWSREVLPVTQRVSRNPDEAA